MQSLSLNPNDLSERSLKGKKTLKLTVHDEINKNSYEIKYHFMGTISGLRDIIYRESKISKNKQRVFYRNYRFKNKDNEKTLDQFNIQNESTLTLQESANAELYGVIKPYQTVESLSKELNDCIFDVNQGFIEGLIPKLSENGTSGTYFLQNVNRKNIAVFKPRDEEPFMPNNPKGYNNIKGEKMGFRKGIRPGESHIRERAAFLLDNRKFHGVPPTCYAKVNHKRFNQTSKKGSFQLFSTHDDVAGNYSSSLFSNEEVHRIALLDLRILNCDRNEENILIKKLKHHSSSNKTSYYYHLIPIDHGLCLPDCFEICNYEIVWMDWPQVKEPLSKETLKFIEAIDPKKDLEMFISQLELRKKCLQNFYLAEILLKNAALKGFSLFEIGNMIYKNDEDDEKNTDIKNLIEKTKYIYEILKSSNNKTLDKWVTKSIHILKEKKSKGDQKKVNKTLNNAINEAIIEEENEEEVKKNPDEIKRRRSFSDNYSLLEEDSSNNVKACAIKVQQLHMQSPDSNSNSTVDDLNFINNNNELVSLSKQISIKFINNEVKIIHQKSPESLALKRSLSLPYFKRNDSKLSKSSGDWELEPDDSFALEGKGKKNLKKTKKKQIKKLKAEHIYDDMFIYYFESFLNQLLDLKMKEKSRAKNIFRNRVLSSEVNSLN